MRVTDEEHLSRKVSLLKSIPLFSVLDPPNLDHLASSSRTLTLSPGQTLFKQGDVGREVYLITSGEAEIISEIPEGVITLATLRENQIVGEVAALIDVPRTATVLAMQELTALVISKETFFQLLENFPTIGIEVMCEMARRMSQTTAKVREISSGDESAQTPG